jgi:hypothetical protein
MITQGLAALGMTYAGLSSFEANSHLFGEMGEAMADPIEGVKAFVREGVKRYKEGSGTVTEKLRAGMLSDANQTGKDDLKLSRRVSKYAEEDLETERNIRAFSQYFASKEAEAATNRVAEEMSQVQTVNAEYIRRASMRKRLQSTDGGTLGGFTTPASVRRSFQAAGATFNVPGRALAAGEPQSMPTPHISPDKTRGLSALDVPDKDKDMEDWFRAFESHHAGGADESLASLTKQEAQDLRGGELREAYRKYYRMDTSGRLDPPENMSVRDLEMLERVDTGFRGVIEGVQKNRSRQGGTQADYDDLFSQARDLEQGRPQLPMEATNPMAGDANAYSDLSAMAGEMPSGFDPTDDLLQHHRSLNDKIQARSGQRAVLSTADGQGAPNEMILEEMRSKGSTVDRMAAQTFQRFDWAMGKINSRLNNIGSDWDDASTPSFDFTLQKVSVDENHHIYEGKLLQDGEQVGESMTIGLPSEGGTYRPDRSTTPFTHPMQKMFSGDMFEGTPMRRTIHQRGLTAGPHELAIGRMSQYIEKFINDVVEGRPSGAVDFMNRRIIADTFEDKSKVKNPMQAGIGALESRKAAETIFNQVSENPTRRQQFEEGLDSLSRMRSLYNTGQRYFAADSEFLSPESIGGAGTTGSAKTPFEVAGSVIDPDTDTAKADILYRMDLSRINRGDDGRAERVKDEVRETYRKISDKSKGQVDELINTMEKGGELKVTSGGDTYDLLSRKGSGETKGREAAMEAMDWIPDKTDQDTTASYYMKVQNAMLDKHGAGYSVGQNFADAEGTVFGNLSQQTGVQLNDALAEGNVVDTMNLSHIYGSNPGTSRSLRSIVAATYRLDYMQYNQVVEGFKSFQSEYGQSQLREMGTGERKRKLFDHLENEAEVLPTKSDVEEAQEAGREQQAKSIGTERKGKRQFAHRLAQISDDMPEGLQDHTARFDAFMTGRVAMPRLQQMASSPQGRRTEGMMRSALNQAGEFAGDRNFVEQHGFERYGGIDEEGEYQEGPVPFFSNQASAAMGRGVLARPRLLPFYKLQNPVRQLYQRAKPNRLMNAPRSLDDARGGTVETSDGGELPTRGRMVRNSQKQMHQKRMRNFKNGGEQGTVGPNMATSENAPMLFAGAGSATPKQRKLYGGYKSEMQYAVTNRVAYLPNDHNRIYESRAQSTAARRDALMNVNTKRETVDIDLQQVTEGNKAGSESMQQWMERVAKPENADFTLYEQSKHPFNQNDAQRQQASLEQAYKLDQIRKDPNTELNDKTKNIIDRSIEENIRRAKGAGTEPIDMKQSALYDSRAGNADLNVTKGTPLARPTSQDAMVKDPMVMQGHKRMIGVDAAVRINDQKADQLEMTFIEDPGETVKEITAGTKPGTQGVTAGATVGMAGEQGIMEASFMKAKRRDFAGYPRAQIERMYNRAVEELQMETRGGGPFSMDRRNDVLDRLSKSLSHLSGMKESKIRSDVIRDNLPTGKEGESGFADYFEMNYTDEFTKAVEDNTSTTRMMRAAENMGLTMENVFRQGSQMMQEKGTTAEDAKKRMAGLMRQQLSQEIEKLQEMSGPKTQEKYDFDLSGGGPEGQKKKREIEGMVKKLKGQKKQVDELFQNPSGTSISDLDGGSLFDFFVDSESGSVSTAFRVLATSFHMQNPATGGTSLGQQFESGAGRTTLKKRSSMLTAALVGHSASHTMGALGGQGEAAYEAFQGWLSAQSGMAVFDDKRFQKEVVSAMSQRGIDYTDIFDPERVSSDADGNRYYQPKGTDKKIALEKYVKRHFEWDAEEGSLKVNANGQTRTLDINPFSTLRETVRKQAGVVGMITGELKGTDVSGQPLGTNERTLTLEFGGKDTNLKEGRITPEDFHALFGKRTRARQHYQHTENRAPRPNEERAYDGSNVYFGNEARPITGPGDTTLSPDLNYNNTVFNEQFDFLEVSLFGGLDNDQVDLMVKNLRKSGVSEDQLARALMGKEGVAQAFDDAMEEGDLSGRAELNRVLDYIRDSQNTGEPSIYVPTRTGANQAQTQYEGDGVRSSNVKQWTGLADRLDPQNSMDSIRHVQSAVESIHRKAQQVDTDTRAGQEALRETFERNLNDTIDSGAFQEVQDLFSASIERGAQSLIKQMEEAQGRYMGGEYKVSATQTDMIFDRFNNLLPETHLGEEGPSDSFKQEIRRWMDQQRPDMALENADQFDKKVDQVAGDLHTYMQEQMGRLDQKDDISNPGSADHLNKWRGFGVGEGFMGRSKARQVLGAMEAKHRTYEDMPKQTTGLPTEQTNAQRRAKERLEEAVGEGRSVRDASQQELDIVRQEINKPGSTSGVIMSTIRQPDFQVSAGYEMSRLNVMGDEAMRALGADPEQLHMFSHPLASWSRKEDYDYDLNFMAAIDDTVQAHNMRQTRANDMPIHMVNLFQMQQNAVQPSGDVKEGTRELGTRELNVDRFTSEVDEYQLDDGTTVKARRVTTNLDAGEEVFERSVSQFFGAEGLAKQARAGGEEARRKYALQKSIVGQFGAYAKQGAIKTRQRSSAFQDTMKRLVKERDRLAEKIGGSDPGDKAMKQANQVFSAMFKRDLPDVHQKGEIGDGWKQMMDTYEKTKRIRRDERGVFDELHKAALTEAEITETIAIEKYKSGNPEQVSKRANDILQALHGNHQGGYDTFESAWSGLKKLDQENMPFPVHQMFGSPEDSVARREELAKEAFRAQYDMSQAMNTARSAGVGSDYMPSFANVPGGEIPVARQLSMAAEEANIQMGGEALQTYASKAASRAFRSGEMTDRMRQFHATEAYRESHARDVLANPTNTRESFSQMLDNIPVGGKALGVTAAAAAVVSAAAPAPKEGTGMGQESRGLPQGRKPRQRIGSRQSGRQLMQIREGAAREASFMRVSGGGATGQQYSTPRPPTRRAEY